MSQNKISVADAAAAEGLDEDVWTDGIEEDPETGGKIIALRHPIAVGERTVDQLRLKRPKMKHMRDMEKAKGGEMDQVARLLVSLSGEAAGVIDALDAADMVRAVKVIEGFIGPFLEIGRT